jgi:hypothetical protein
MGALSEGVSGVERVVNEWLASKSDNQSEFSCQVQG